MDAASLEMSNLTRTQFLRGDWRERPVSPSPSAFAQIKPACLVRQGVYCRTCGETCEPEAIRFAPAVGRPPMPEIDTDACTGCGECVDVCPTDAVFLKQRQSEENS